MEKVRRNDDDEIKTVGREVVYCGPQPRPNKSSMHASAIVDIDNRGTE